MSNLRMKIIDANSEWFGTPIARLMDNAGRAVAKEANALGDSFVVVCGPGNNGGDGFSAARYLKSKPQIFYLREPEGDEAYENFLRAKNYRPILLTGGTLVQLKKALGSCDVAIDAIFGTGIEGGIREPARSAILAINASKAKVVSIDVPSGVNPDSGKSSDASVDADLTVALHAVKQGVKKSKSSGKIKLADIGIPKKAETHVGRGDFRYCYPKRADNAHKGQAGRVLVLGGSENYVGAPYFAATAALKAGCDLSYVFSPALIAYKISTISPDLIVYSANSQDNLEKADVKKIPAEYDVACIGNGLGLSDDSLSFASAFIRKNKKPIVIDADALSALSEIDTLGKNVVLTPHAGEFKKIFSKEATEKNLKKISEKYEFTILLKGPVDLIAQQGKLIYNDSGNSYMSKGGSGDILAGLCAGLLAQGVEPGYSAALAALLNGVAGDLAYVKKSIAMTASDILDEVGTAAQILLS